MNLTINKQNGVFVKNQINKLLEYLKKIYKLRINFSYNAEFAKNYENIINKIFDYIYLLKDHIINDIVDDNLDGFIDDEQFLIDYDKEKRFLESIKLKKTDDFTYNSRGDEIEYFVGYSIFLIKFLNMTKKIKTFNYINDEIENELNIIYKEFLKMCSHILMQSIDLMEELYKIDEQRRIINQHKLESNKFNEEHGELINMEKKQFKIDEDKNIRKEIPNKDNISPHEKERIIINPDKEVTAGKVGIQISFITIFIILTILLIIYLVKINYPQTQKYLYVISVITMFISFYFNIASIIIY